MQCGNMLSWQPGKGERERERVGGCPHISSDNLYFLQLCVIAILTPNPGQDGGWGGGGWRQQRGVLENEEHFACSSIAHAFA